MSDTFKDKDPDKKFKSKIKLSKHVKLEAKNRRKKFWKIKNIEIINNRSIKLMNADKWNWS